MKLLPLLRYGLIFFFLIPLPARPNLAIADQAIEIAPQVKSCGPGDAERDSKFLIVPERATGVAEIYEDPTFRERSTAPLKNFSLSAGDVPSSFNGRQARSIIHGVVGEYSSFVVIKKDDGSTHTPAGALDPGEVVIPFNENPARPVWMKHLWLDMEYSSFSVHPGDRIESVIKLAPTGERLGRGFGRRAAKWAMVIVNGKPIKRKLVTREAGCLGYGVRVWIVEATSKKEASAGGPKGKTPESTP